MEIVPWKDSADYVKSLDDLQSAVGSVVQVVMTQFLGRQKTRKFLYVLRRALHHTVPDAYLLYTRGTNRAWCRSVGVALADHVVARVDATVLQITDTTIFAICMNVLHTVFFKIGFVLSERVQLVPSRDPAERYYPRYQFQQRALAAAMGTHRRLGAAAALGGLPADCLYCVFVMLFEI